MNLSSPCLLKIPKNWSNKLISCNKCSTLVIPRWPFKIPHSSCNNEAKSFVSALARLVFRALFFNEFENTSLSQDTIVPWMSENIIPHNLWLIPYDSYLVYLIRDRNVGFCIFKIAISKWFEFFIYSICFTQIQFNNIFKNSYFQPKFYFWILLK